MGFWTQIQVQKEMILGYNTTLISSGMLIFKIETNKINVFREMEINKLRFLRHLVNSLASARSPTASLLPLGNS